MVFKFTAKDNRGLAYLELTIPELNIAERMDVEGDNVTESTFEKEITFPSEGTGAYIMTVRVVDIFDNVTEKESTVLVTRLKDYQNMYLVDFEGTDTHLLTDRDVWGIPMPIERTEFFNIEPVIIRQAKIHQYALLQAKRTLTSVLVMIKLIRER